MLLLTPIDVGPKRATNRVVFGPHVTNLGDDDRRLTERHVAYYARRALGGAGTIVVEGASVHPSDWPYERAPLAERCGEGWASVVDACRPHGALVFAGLDHAGGQGSSAYSQSPMWAPSRVPEVNSRELPKSMEPEDIAAVIDGFEQAAAVAAEADVDGVEINAGQHSLVRQFLSGLTNHRQDEWGTDRLLFAREVIAAVRRGLGDGRAIALRLSCDELAPWAGITPEAAPDIALGLVEVGVDQLVVTRGSIYSIEKTRPDLHEPPGFNIDLTRRIRSAVRESHPGVAVVLQGSVVDVGQAEWALGGYDDPALADGVEMTRAQIADPDLVASLRAGTPDAIRPCTRCNQTCQVRDARNPIVTCVGEPSSGHETDDPDWYTATPEPKRVTIVGGGPAGLEVGRVAARRGHQVTVLERRSQIGGIAAVAGPHKPLIDWYEREHGRLGTAVRLDVADSAVDDAVQAALDDPDAVVVQCTGSSVGRKTYLVDPALRVGSEVIDIAALRLGECELPTAGRIVVFDPIGGPIAVGLAEELGDRAVLITQDNIAGNELARTGDLAPANSRLQQQGVEIVRRAVLREVRSGPGGITVCIDDRFSGERTEIDAVALVDCGFRLPTDPIEGVEHRAGDAVAPRTVLEAVLEGRRVALDL